MTAWLFQAPWVPVTAPLTSGTALRTPNLLVLVVAQFDVENTKRYRAAAGQTFCNIFAWDVTRALGCEVPHWWMGRELTANALARWFTDNGREHGWVGANESAARANAGEGKPTVALWKNPAPGKPGHIAVLVPSGTDDRTQIAQAGASNFSRGPLANGFGTKTIAFYMHA